MSNFDIDDKSVHRKQKEIAELSDKAIPIAIQQTLTATARHAWRYGRENTKSEFKTRNNWSAGSQRYSRAEGLNPEKMVATAGTTAGYMAEQEHGFTRSSSGKSGVWVPTAEAAGQTGVRTRPITRKYRKGKIRLRKKIRKKPSSPKQQRLFKMYDAVSTNGYFWGTLNNTTGMWHLAGSVFKGRIVLTGVRLLYSANKRSIVTKPTKWHGPATERAFSHDEAREYDKALGRQLKRLKVKYKGK